MAPRQAICRKVRPDWRVRGIPEVLYSDQGGGFTSWDIEQVAGDPKLRPINSMVGRPQGRGKLEPFFESVARALLSWLCGGTPAELARFPIDAGENTYSVYRDGSGAAILPDRLMYRQRALSDINSGGSYRK